MLPRKIISASVSGTLFVIILGLIFPDLIGGENIDSIQSYLYSTISSIPFYMIYSLPAILIYGTLTSVISDKIGEFISIKVENKRAEIIISGALHILFGLILLWVSLGASILFFITDRILRSHNKKYEWLGAIKSLAIPVLTWLICMGIFWGKDMLLN